MNKIVVVAAWVYSLLAGVLLSCEYVLSETWHSASLPILFTVASVLLAVGVLIDALRGQLFSWPVVFMGYFAFKVARHVPTIGDAIRDSNERLVVTVVALGLCFAGWHFSPSIFPAKKEEKN